MLARIPVWNQELLAKDPASRLVSLVSIDSELWRSWDATPPKEMRRFDDKKSRSGSKIFNSNFEGELLFPANAAQIFLMVKANRADFCFELTKIVIAEFGRDVANSFQYSGFRYMDGRDLSGFIDGTRNPDHMLRALVDQVVIFPDDDGKTSSSHVGGTYMYAGRFVHNLSKVNFSSFLLD